MTERQQFEVLEQRAEIFKRDCYTCQHCGLSVFQYGTPQLAHLIAQTKANLKRYGKAVIHHPLNMASTCSLECNAAMNIGMNPGKVKALVREIESVIDKGTVAIDDRKGA
jgi:5-methylcytosine-specific restriction endonuclease McrA